MKSNTKLMDYVSFLNSRLEKQTKQKFYQAENCYNQTITSIKSTICKEEAELIKIKSCPSDNHRLSLKYLGPKSYRRSPRAFQKDYTNITLTTKENDFSKFYPKSPKKFNIQSHDVITKSVTEIPLKQNFRLEKSLTFFGKPFNNSIPEIPISSSTILKDSTKDNILPPINRKNRSTPINKRIKRFIVSIEQINEDNIDLKDFTTSQEYWDSVLLSKSDFDWKKKTFYDSRKSSLVGNT